MLVNNLVRRTVLCPADVSPSRDDLKVIGTFNPGATRSVDDVVLLVRVAEGPRHRRPGFTGLPRWEGQRGIVIDWFADDKLERVDTRVARSKSDGLARLTFTSYLKVLHSPDGIDVPDCRGLDFLPESPYEEFGVEDPRITPLDGRYYITYVVVSRHGVATALASTEDFRTFTRHGIVFGPENKDVVLFPERIEGQYVALHRPSGAAGFCRPGIWLARSPDLIHWGEHEHVLGVGASWDSGRIGPGPPPLRVAEGWLVLYHGTTQSKRPGDVGIYSAGAMLLAHEDPGRVLHRSAAPLFAPQADFERNGFVPNVVFPTGIVADGSSLCVYYGAADTSSAVVRLSLAEIVDSLRSET